MILLKNFLNESCTAWRGTHDGNADLIKIRSRPLLFF